MKRGELVPDSLVLKMVAKRIEEPDCTHGFVFDGFPRRWRRRSTDDSASAEWLQAGSGRALCH